MWRGGVNTYDQFACIMTFPLLTAEVDSYIDLSFIQEYRPLCQASSFHQSYMFVCGRFDSVFTFTAFFYHLLLPYQTCELPFLILFTYFLSSEFFKHSS
jgi:hypothetical protein